METGLSHPLMEAEVAKRLPSEGGLRPAEIASQHPALVNSSVRAALLRMVRDGRVVREGEIGGYRYRKCA
jgi:hypothetical protein